MPRTAFLLICMVTGLSSNCEAQNNPAVNVHAYERDVVGGIPAANTIHQPWKTLPLLCLVIVIESPSFDLPAYRVPSHFLDPAHGQTDHLNMERIGAFTPRL